ncbi:hypothetical protein HIM_04132 [Hirsutella minnesotensis 3608]|uniref:Laccase-2 n=1 Tax=Hirsutella minnesotensis 3608 TaxID=1043627 RepID=A0A0F7ZVD1_9HYPO|nr:hypothetical protein HIM_04132 [Hirsutella minnesotensis 3608]
MAYEQLSPDFWSSFIGRSIRPKDFFNPQSHQAGLANLNDAVSQFVSNGLSQLGTLSSQFLPDFLKNNPLPHGFPWGEMTSQTNYYNDHPNTGVIRRYDWTISRGVLAPDGYARPMLLVNGAFPGPLLEANWGDTIQVTVRNNITGPEEGCAIHWHGFLQKASPWEDGVPGVDQCPIAPGQTYTYQFVADLYGSSWYHSHYSAQYAGGILGPMVIHGPVAEKYDIDVGPVLLTDWYHDSYFSLVEKTMSEAVKGFFFSDNNLINGKNAYNCTVLGQDDRTPCTSDATLAKFRFRRGKIHRLRLVNAGAEGLQRFSIDGHTMKVIANDFVPVVPYETKVVTLGIGQRADVLVKANGYLNSYWMRSNISTECSLANNPDALAAIYYDDADPTELPQSTAWNVPDPATCLNDDLSLTKPQMQLPVPYPDLTLQIDVNQFTNASNISLWTMGNVTFRANYNSPTLLLSNAGNYSFDEEWNVKNVGAAKSVRVVVNNLSKAAHPMHLHGYNMYILHVGKGRWDGSIVRPRNPERRDVIQLPGQSTVVMQFDAAGNPGVWPFHCHIAWHVSAGLLTQFLANPVGVRKRRIPHVVAETCRQWSAFTDSVLVDQIDSGL